MMIKAIKSFRQIAEDHWAKPQAKVSKENSASTLLSDINSALAEAEASTTHAVPLRFEVSIEEQYGMASYYSIKIMTGSMVLLTRNSIPEDISIDTIEQVFIFFNDDLDACYHVSRKNNGKTLIGRIRTQKRTYNK